jgi:hypothetical protein
MRIEVAGSLLDILETGSSESESDGVVMVAASNESKGVSVPAPCNSNDHVGGRNSAP